MKVKAYKIVFLPILFCFFSCVDSYTKIKTELYFGLSNAQGKISHKEWSSFKAETVDKILNGYTLINAQGCWTSNDTTFSERSVVLVYIHDDNADESKKIDSLIYTYRQRFKQESVLRTDQKVKAIF